MILPGLDKRVCFSQQSGAVSMSNVSLPILSKSGFRRMLLCTLVPGW